MDDIQIELAQVAKHFNLTGGTRVIFLSGNVMVFRFSLPLVLPHTLAFGLKGEGEPVFLMASRVSPMSYQRYSKSDKLLFTKEKRRGFVGFKKNIAHRFHDKTLKTFKVQCNGFKKSRVIFLDEVFLFLKRKKKRPSQLSWIIILPIKTNLHLYLPSNRIIFVGFKYSIPD